MTDSHALFEALERALGTHARALASTDPLALELANSELATLLSSLRGQLRRKADVDQSGAELAQLRARFAAHGAVIARAASGNRAALTAMGLVDQSNALLPTGARYRRAMHFLA